LSSWTSAFGIPLVQDQNVLVLDWQMSGSFLPCKLLNFLEKIIANMDGKLNATSMLDKTVLDQRFTKKNQNKQSDMTNFVIVPNSTKFHTWKPTFIWITQERLALHLVQIW